MSMIARYKVLLILATSLALPGVYAKTAYELVADAKSAIHEVTVAEAAEVIEGGVIVIDVREPGEFASGHIDGAVNIPRGLLEFRVAQIEALKELPIAEQHQTKIVLYCRSGGRSALATARLQEMGYQNVHSLQGGFNAWQAEASDKE